MNIITKSYESLLPFLVVEAISSKEIAFNSMSFRMMNKGWAWLVAGRKLLVWRFKETEPQTVRTRRTLSPRYELQLPQSDLAHKADLIHVFFMPPKENVPTRAATAPATLVVSPAGTIRLWSNIANEKFIEFTVSEMSGQVFCTLAPLSPYEYLLGTTTGSVYMLTIDIRYLDPKRIFSCSPLAEPSGLLSGISRRMSNFFLGPMATDNNIGKRPLIAVPKYSQSTIDKTGSRDRPFFILSSSLKLRQWARSNDGVTYANHLVREWDLQKNIYEELLGGLGLTECDPLELWLVDMITTKSKELLILLVVLDRARDNVNYVTCGFNPYQAGDSISNLTILRSHTKRSSNETEDQLTSFRFIERQATTSTCFIYNRQFLFLVQPDEDILDAIDYLNQNDGILGAGMVDNHPLLFTQRGGLTYVVPSASDKSRFNDTSIQLETPMPNNPSILETSASSQSNTTMLSRSRHENSMLSKSRMSNRPEPMLVDLEEEEEGEEEDGDKNSTEPNQSRLSQGETSKSMNESTKPLHNIDQVDNFLKTSEEFAWMSQIENKQYGLASETLANLANSASDEFDEWKETFQSLSKLAKIAE